MTSLKYGRSIIQHCARPLASSWGDDVGLDSSLDLLQYMTQQIANVVEGPVSGMLVRRG